MKSHKVTIAFVNIPLELVYRILSIVSKLNILIVLLTLVITYSNFELDVFTDGTLLPVQKINANRVHSSPKNTFIGFSRFRAELLVDTTCFSRIFNVLFLV